MITNSMTSASWYSAIRGNHERFNRTVEPHLPELLQAARRDIAYRQKRGELSQGDVSADELVGETLVRAWHDRANCPDHVDLRAWLIGTQHRVLEQLIHLEKRPRELWSISLDDPAPPEPIGNEVGSDFWKWYQPNASDRWEDQLPDDAPTPGEVLLFGEEETHLLEPRDRQVLVMHDRHRLLKSEVASAARVNPRDVKITLRDARRMILNARG